MTVSVEVITMLASVATILVALVSGFGWMVGRMDARFAQQDAKWDARFAQADEREESRFAQVDARFDQMDAKWEARFAQVDARFAEIGRDITEIKVEIARMEGPRRHLQPLP